MIAFVVAIIIAALVYLCYKQCFNLWRSQRINGPFPFPIFGTFFDYMTRPMHEVDNERFKRYGRIYGTYEGSKPTLMIAEPELIKKVLIKDFYAFTNRRHFEVHNKMVKTMLTLLRNEEWKRVRSIIAPTFTSGKLKRMKPLFMTCVNHATDFLDKVCSTGEDIDLKLFWDKYTMEVIGRCCFATDFNFYENENNEYVTHVKKFFNPPKIMLLLFFLTPQILSGLLAKLTSSNSTIDYFESLVTHLINERKNKPGNYNDFLQLMIEAETEEKEGESITTKKLNVNEIIGQSMLFFSAGFETTAATLQYICYLLTIYPEIQEKLHQELIDCPDANDIDYDCLKKLPYLDAVINETLRLFPILPKAEREAGIDIKYDEYGVIIPKKTLVGINVYSLHHDPEYFEEPEVFKPERFLPENRENIHPYTYFPFGGGPRNCVAMRFALIEMKFAIFITFRNFKLIKSKNTPEKPIFKNFSGFMSCQNIKVSVIKR